VLLGLVHNLSPIDVFDQKIYDFAFQISDPMWLWINRLQSMVGDVGFLLPMSVLLAVLLFRKQKKSFLLPTAYVMVQVGNYLLKVIFDRVRPESLVSGYHLTTNSYPSGHSSGAMVFFGMFYLLFIVQSKPNKRALFGFAMAILFIGLSRIFLGAHWASDVLGGYLFGFSVLLFFKKKYLSNKTQ